MKNTVRILNREDSAQKLYNYTKMYRLYGFGLPNEIGKYMYNIHMDKDIYDRRAADEKDKKNKHILVNTKEYYDYLKFAGVPDFKFEDVLPIYLINGLESVDVLNEFAKNKAEMVMVTNTEFNDLNATFYPVLNELLSISPEEVSELNKYVSCQGGKWKSNDFNKAKHNESVISIAKGMYKGYSGEEKLAKALYGFKEVYHNVNLEFNGEHLEVDTLVLHDGGLIVIEVKDYSGEVITMDSSGDFRVTYSNGEEKKLDTLSQVSRCNRILHNIFGNINIVNYITLTDADTRIVNNLNSETLKIVSVDLISFEIQKLKYENTDYIAKNKEFLLSYAGKENKFEKFDVIACSEKLKTAIENDVKEIRLMINNHEGIVAMVNKSPKQVSLINVNPGDININLIEGIVTVLEKLSSQLPETSNS